MITFPGLPPVDRADFIPDEVLVKRRNVDGKVWAWVPLSRHTNPEEWADLVAGEGPIITQARGGVFPSSSSSAPSLMAKMIKALRLEPGMRVLEIGAGTGWNAACLAALGAHVVTVEVDEGIAEHARSRLSGYPTVEVITGDGLLGYPDGAPYDRVLASAAAHTIPYAWVRQSRDGGLIVAPYTGEGRKYGLLVLHVDDGVASGGFEGDASFMPLRGQGLDQSALRAIETRPGLQLEVTPGGQRLS